LLTVHCLAQNSPTISFDKKQYYLEEGESTDICVQLTDFEDIIDQQNVYVVNGELTTNFLDFQSKSIPLTSGKFCFQLNSKPSDGKINYKHTVDLEFQTENSEVSTGPISSASIILQDDVSSQSSKTLTPILIKGFDNKTSGKESFSISLINTVPLVSGSSFIISNSNYSELEGWLPKNNYHEYIEVHWTGNEILEAGSIICISNNVDSTQIGLSNHEGISILLNGSINDGFDLIANHENSFLSELTWSNVYILSKVIEPFSNEPIEVYDGITYGIDSSLFAFDIPFEDQAFQLFLTENIGIFYGFVLCSELNEICDLIEFIKDINNWTIDSGNNQDQLIEFEICSDLCDVTFCPTREVIVEEVCYNNMADVIFVLDESGSIVNSGEFDDIKSIVSSTSSTLNCLSDSLRFAVVAFSNGSNGGYHIIQNFQSGDVNIDNYNPPTSQSTNVARAYNALLADLNNNTIDVRDGANLEVILLTDAPYNTYYPFSPFNAIKDVPHQANHSVVYFEDYEPVLSAETAAAIASKGEPYHGNIVDNPTDPEGPGGPRKLFIYENITPNIAESISILSNCNEILLSLDPEKTIVNSLITASDGGEIIEQISEFQFITNGQGTYDIEVNTEENCTYKKTFAFEELQNCLPETEAIQEQNSEVDNRSKSNHLRYEDTEVKLSDEHFDAQILPIPASEHITITISDSKNIANGEYTYTVYNANGKHIRKGNWNSKTNSINVRNMSQGLYTIKITDLEGNTIIKKFVVVK